MLDVELKSENFGFFEFIVIPTENHSLGAMTIVTLGDGLTVTVRSPNGGVALVTNLRAFDGYLFSDDDHLHWVTGNPCRSSSSNEWPMRAKPSP